MKYIVGPTSRLGVTAKPPRIVCIGGRSNDQPRALWFAEGVISRTMFAIKRGVVQEDRDFTTNEIIYAREVPSLAEDSIADVDAKIEAAERALKEARDEKQELLAAVVRWAEPIRISPEQISVARCRGH